MSDSDSDSDPNELFEGSDDDETAFLVRSTRSVQRTAPPSAGRIRKTAHEFVEASILKGSFQCAGCGKVIGYNSPKLQCTGCGNITHMECSNYVTCPCPGHIRRDPAHGRKKAVPWNRLKSERIGRQDPAGVTKTALRRTKKSETSLEEAELSELKENLLEATGKGMTSEVITLLCRMKEYNGRAKKEHRLDINDVTDAKNNNLLHLAVERNDSYLTTELIIYGMRTQAKNAEKKTPLELALKDWDSKKDAVAAALIKKMENAEVRKLFTPGSAFQFQQLVSKGFVKATEEVLNSLIDRSKEKGKKQKCEAFYEILEADVKGRDAKQTNCGHMCSTIYQWMALGDHKDIINHDAVRLLTRWKWDKFAKRIFGIEIAAYMFTVFCLTFVAVTAATSDDARVYDSRLQHARAVFEVILIVCVMIKLYTEIMQLIRSQRKYFWDPLNVLEMTAAVTLVAVVPLRFAAPDVHWYFLALGYGLWLCIVFKYAVIFRASGIHAQILWQILQSDVLQFSLLFLVVNLVFAGTFLLMLKADGNLDSNYETSSFHAILYVGLRTLVEGGPVVEYSGDSTFGVMSTIVLLLFLFLTVVILLNILIAQVNNTYTNIQESADKNYELSLAKIIAWIEINGSVFPKWKKWRRELDLTRQTIYSMSDLLDVRKKTKMEDVRDETGQILRKQVTNEGKLSAMMADIAAVREVATSGVRDGMVKTESLKRQTLMQISEVKSEMERVNYSTESFLRSQDSSMREIGDFRQHVDRVIQLQVQKMVLLRSDRTETETEVRLKASLELVERLTAELRAFQAREEERQARISNQDVYVTRSIQSSIKHDDVNLPRISQITSPRPRVGVEVSLPGVNSDRPSTTSRWPRIQQRTMAMEFDVPDMVDEGAAVPDTADNFNKQMNEMEELKLLGMFSSGKFKIHKGLLPDGDTALHIAAGRGMYHVVRHLISNGAELLTLSEKNKDYAIERALKGNYDMTASLIAKRLDKATLRGLFTRPDPKTPPRLNIMDYLDERSPNFLRIVLNAMVDETTVYYGILEADCEGFKPNDPEYKDTQQTVFNRIAREGNKNIISTTAIRSLIDRKWENYARGRFFFQMVSYLLSLTSLTVAVVMGIVSDDVTKYNGTSDGVRAVFELAIYAFMLLVCLPNEILELKKKKLQYFQGFDLLEGLSAVLILACLPVRYVEVRAHWYILAVAYLLWTTNIFKYAAVFRQYGAYAQMLWLIVKSDVVQFSVLFAVVNLAFSGTYFLALKAEDRITVSNETSSFHDIMYAGLQTVSMGGPVMSYTDGYGVFSVVIKMAFLFVTLVILLNILIAQLSNTYTNIQGDAQRHLRVRMARLIVSVEHGVWACFRQIIMLNNIQGDAQRHLLVRLVRLIVSVEHGVWACFRQTDVKNFYTPQEIIKDTGHNKEGNLMKSIDANIKRIGDKQVKSQMNLNLVKAEVAECSSTMGELMCHMGGMNDNEAEAREVGRLCNHVTGMRAGLDACHVATEKQLAAVMGMRDEMQRLSVALSRDVDEGRREMSSSTVDRRGTYRKRRNSV